MSFNLRSLQTLGEWGLLMRRTFARPDRLRMFFQMLVKEIYKLGVDSLGIVVIISFFIGAVIAIQLSLNMVSPLIPRFTIGYSTREIVLLEFSSSIMCLILAGKVGSSVASELGTMRTTEQIDAMEIMGVNSANYLILPKILGFMIFIPVLSIISMFTCIIGGYTACFMVPNLPINDFEYGLQLFFQPYSVCYSIIKSLVYAFLIASVSSFYGYSVKGGALEVGKASTKAVVKSSILILVFDLILTKLLLA